MRRGRALRVAVLVVVSTVSPGAAHTVDLDDIVEIRGYQPPPTLARFTVK